MASYHRRHLSLAAVHPYLFFLFFFLLLRHVSAVLISTPFMAFQILLPVYKRKDLKHQAPNTVHLIYNKGIYQQVDLDIISYWLFGQSKFCWFELIRFRLWSIWDNIICPFNTVSYRRSCNHFLFCFWPSKKKNAIVYLKSTPLTHINHDLATRTFNIGIKCDLIMTVRETKHISK